MGSLLPIIHLSAWAISWLCERCRKMVRLQGIGSGIAEARDWMTLILIAIRGLSENCARNIEGLLPDECFVLSWRSWSLDVERLVVRPAQLSNQNVWVSGNGVYYIQSSAQSSSASRSDPCIELDNRQLICDRIYVKNKWDSSANKATLSRLLRSDLECWTKEQPVWSQVFRTAVREPSVLSRWMNPIDLVSPGAKLAAVIFLGHPSPGFWQWLEGL